MLKSWKPVSGIGVNPPPHRRAVLVIEPDPLNGSNFEVVGAVPPSKGLSCTAVPSTVEDVRAILPSAAGGGIELRPAVPTGYDTCNWPCRCQHWLPTYM